MCSLSERIPDVLVVEEVSHDVKLVLAIAQMEARGTPECVTGARAGRILVGLPKNLAVILKYAIVSKKRACYQARFALTCVQVENGAITVAERRDICRLGNDVRHVGFLMAAQQAASLLDTKPGTDKTPAPALLGGVVDRTVF